MPSLSELKVGGKGEVARALSLVEQAPFAPATVALLDAAFREAKGTVIGITGPPGAGKSTLIDAMIAEWRGQGKTVAVLAVDPSSARTGGALLGDRVRMRTDPNDSGVFVRSVAARGRLGGLSDVAFPAAILLRALFDKVIVESVGVGQSETDIAAVADTVVLCIQPASGDSLQFMKAGIAEIPDIAVVMKADLGAAASRALADLKGALSLSVSNAEDFVPLCLALSSTARIGLADYFTALEKHRSWLHERDRVTHRRLGQGLEWIVAEITTLFGREGLNAVRTSLEKFDRHSPFQTIQFIRTRLHISWSGE